MRLAKYLFLPIVFILLSLNIPAFAQQSGSVTRLTVAGQEFNGDIGVMSVSDDGRYIAFLSDSTNIVPNDFNGVSDVFVYDQQTQTYSRVSVSSAGVEANSMSSEVAISGDGRYVAFTSYANNLVAGDTNVLQDIFLHDRQTAQTTRILLDYNGNEVILSPSYSPYFGIDMSADGRYISFESDATTLVANDTNAVTDMFVYDRQTATNIRVSVDSSGNQANENSSTGNISSNGRYVVFRSSATNLVAGDTNNMADVFRYDLQTGTIIRVSLANGGGQALYTGSDFSVQIGYNLSSDGRYVTFTSNANNLVAGDTNGDVWDLFVHDTQTLTTKRVSVSSGGAQANDISGTTFVSDDGRYVIYESLATNLVAGDTNGTVDVFMRDTQLNVTTRLSLTPTGGQTNDKSGLGGVSVDMRYLVLVSDATDIITTDGNNATDIFIYDRLQLGTPTLTAPANGTNTNNPNVTFSWTAVTSATGYQIQIAFDSGFTDIIHDHILSATSYAYLFNNNSIYYWRVRAKAGGAVGNWSSVRNVIVSPPSPPISAPTLIAPANLATRSNPNVTFSWNTVVFATQHQIQISTNNGFTAIVHDQTLSATSYAYTFTLAGTYYWRVRGKNGAGNGPWSSVRSFTLQSMGAPELIAPANNGIVNNFVVDFNWGSVIGAPEYQIQVSTDNTFWNVIINQTLTATDYTHTFTSFATYYWKVRGKNGSNYTSWSSTYQFALAPLAAPTLIAPVNNYTASSQSVTFSWEPVAGADEYQFQLGYMSGSLFQSSIDVDVATTSITHDFSSSNQRHWRVRAKNSNSIMDGDWSVIRQLNPIGGYGPYPLHTPSYVFTSQSLTTAPVTFNWEPLTYATQYQLQVSTDYSFNTIIIDQLVTTNSFIASLDVDELYYWRVRGINGSNIYYWTRGEFIHQGHPFVEGKTVIIPDRYNDVHQYSSVKNLSSDGRYILEDYHLYDRQTNSVVALPITNESLGAWIGTPVSTWVYNGMSSNARYISIGVSISGFWGTNIVLFDRETEQIINIPPLNTNNLDYYLDVEAISDDGRWLSIYANGFNKDNLSIPYIPLRFLYDVHTGEYTQINDFVNYPFEFPFLDYVSDGGSLAFIRDSLAYVYDGQTRQTTLLLENLVGAPITGATAEISKDGQFVVICAGAESSSLYHIPTGAYTTNLFNQCPVAFSPDARFFALKSPDVPSIGTTYDIYIYDRQTDTTQPLASGFMQYEYPSVRFGDSGHVMFTAFQFNLIPNLNLNGIKRPFLYNFIPTIVPADMPILTYPTDTMFTGQLTHELKWEVVNDASRYQLQIATDSAFTTVLYDAEHYFASHTQTFPALNTYYWRVRAINSLGTGPWSATYTLIIGESATAEINEQEIFNSTQVTLTDGMTFALFDITPTGILTTIQFDDGAVVTTTVKLVAVNGLVQIRLEGTSGGTPAQRQILADRVPSLIMNSFDEFMPEGYFLIEGVSMTSSTLDFDVVLPND